MQPETADLEACLDATRTALMAGDMVTLAKLAGLVEVAIASSGRPEGPALLRVKKKAEANGRILQAALKGVRAARQRAQELSNHGRFSTYDAGGRRDQIGVAAAIPARRL